MATPEISQTAPPGSLESYAVIPGVRWYHLADPSSSALDELAAHFGIHALQVEDCRHRRQTPRLEEHERYSFVVIKALSTSAGEKRANRGLETPSEEGLLPGGARDSGTQAKPSPKGPSVAGAGRVGFEDFDIFIGPDYVFTVDEGDSNLVASVTARISAETSLQNPDRIAHALIDAAVDRYLPALDRVGEVINRLEDRVLHHPTPATLREIFRLKRELLEFRRVATAMREAVNGLLRRYDAASARSPQVDRDLRAYYRDVYDHVVRVVEFVETYRDLLTGSLDIYLSAVANRTNEVMKVLTLWGTVALPLLILTGFYGMNVKLPLQDDPLVLALLGLAMVGSSVGILYYFRRKNWF